MSLRDRVRRISFSVLGGVVLGVALVFVGLRFVESPKERSLERQLASYKRQTRLLGDRVERAEKVLQNLEERDSALYRTIFDSDPVSSSRRHSGIGGVERYAEFDRMENGELLKNTTRMVDDLTKRIYVESQSLDELYSMALTKNERLAAMPAIMPVSKAKGKVVSGFGYRFHPILHYRRLHAGIDISAPKNTPIYATADGVVRVAGRNPQGYSGYGVVAVIDHGYGFQTLYAHMQTVQVRVGQKVVRGQQIGAVGSSGMSTGSHLHYEVVQNGKNVDPVYFFYNDLTPDEYEEVLEQARQENQSMS